MRPIIGIKYLILFNFQRESVQDLPTRIGTRYSISMAINLKLLVSAVAASVISALIAVNRAVLSSGPGSQNLSKPTYIRKDVVFPTPFPIPGAFGPESLEFDSAGGGPYTGVSDGRIIKWEEKQGRWTDFATTSSEREGCGGRDDEAMEHICGRPLGLSFNRHTGELYVADAYMGLLVVGPNGGLATKVATEAHGVTFGFTNGIDVDRMDETVFFSDSSTRYQRRDHVAVVMSGDKTGRLMKYDPKTQEVTVLLDGIGFANGLALSQNGHFLLLAETTYCRILRFWLQTSKAGTLELFAHLPGYPDNIRRNENGEFWVAMHSGRSRLLQWLLSYSWIGKTLLRLPFPSSIFSKWRNSGFAVRLSEEGEILEILVPRRGNNGGSCISEVYERNGTLWIGSVTMSSLGKYEMKDKN